MSEPRAVIEIQSLLYQVAWPTG